MSLRGCHELVCPAAEEAAEQFDGYPHSFPSYDSSSFAPARATLRWRVAFGVEKLVHGLGSRGSRLVHLLDLDQHRVEGWTASEVRQHFRIERIDVPAPFRFTPVDLLLRAAHAGEQTADDDGVAVSLAVVVIKANQIAVLDAPRAGIRRTELDV